MREGIIKHSRDFGPGEYPYMDEYLPGLRPPLEAQLIDLADEAAYNAADLDDAFQANFFTAAEISAAVPAYAAILNTVETQFPGATEQQRFQETLRQLIDDVASGLIEGTAAAAREAGLETSGDVRRHPLRIARFSPQSRETSLKLKQFLHQHVYCSESLSRDRAVSMERLSRLFQYLMHHPDRLSSAESDVPLHQAVCDFIAGMTDRYFIRFYKSVVDDSAPDHSSTGEKLESSASRTT